MTDKKPHGNTGRRNAARDKSKDAHIHVRCYPEFKLALEEAAQSENKRLARFITDHLSSVESVKKILKKLN